ncbi:Short-chain dehydrogenase [Faunimonas pinastri]|uniref:Short-chain dehydrogenase n=1 Tax=Faunimonas pinastri TaxID=1855383 RepID=A0A1H8ZV02_9HYPH|nr:SDR family oxidoreductase [Faunimonas pinastri]SEP68155.1 Short-chain dehydrogenase [Faunimonas pinastri]
MSKLKKVADQVIVITGATSGIGLATARTAAEKGAKLVLVARSEETLKEITQEIRAKGGEAIYVVADVGDEGQVKAASTAAIGEFGHYDTWINNAGVSIFGTIEETSTEDLRRLFETNFWGLVYGSRAAVEHFRQRGGGKLINLGSVASDVSIPLQGMYSASKHAVAGFTDALRMEVKHERLPISITLIKPTSIGTPFKDHAKNYMDKEPTLPPVVYDVQIVADTIVYAAEHDVRDMMVGGGGRMMKAMAGLMPKFSDWMGSRTMPSAQKTNKPAPGVQDRSLYKGGADGSERSDYPQIRKTSVYTTMEMHPTLTALGLAVGALVVTGLVLRSRSSSRPLVSAKTMRQLGRQLPDRSTLASYIPDSSTLRSYVPSARDVRSHLPSAHDVRSALPSASTVKSQLPSRSTLASYIPSASTVASYIPSVSDMQSTASDLKRQGRKAAEQLPDKSWFAKRWAAGSRDAHKLASHVPDTSWFAKRWEEGSRRAEKAAKQVPDRSWFEKRWAEGSRKARKATERTGLFG